MTGTAVASRRTQIIERRWVSATFPLRLERSRVITKCLACTGMIEVHVDIDPAHHFNIEAAVCRQQASEKERKTKQSFGYPDNSRTPSLLDEYSRQHLAVAESFSATKVVAAVPTGL